MVDIYRQLQVKITQRSKKKNEWKIENPILLDGEFGIESDTGLFKCGDGITKWNELDYFFGNGVSISSCTSFDDLPAASENQYQIILVPEEYTIIEEVNGVSTEKKVIIDTPYISVKQGPNWLWKLISDYDSAVDFDGNITGDLKVGGNAIIGINSSGGNYSLITGNNNNNTGLYNIVGGWSNNVEANANIVSGNNNEVTTNGNLVIGVKNKVIGGSGYNQVGGYNTVINNGSHNDIFGRDVTINTAGTLNLIRGEAIVLHNGSYNTILGNNIILNGPDYNSNYNVLEGQNHRVYSSVGYNHIEGKGHFIYARYAHIEGSAHRIGMDKDGNITASNEINRVHIEGWGNIATESDQHIAGKYNNTVAKAQRITGWGSSDTNRKNIEVLDQSGNLWLAGNVTVGTNKLPLATQKYADTVKTELVDGADSTHNTLKKLGDLITSNSNSITNGQTAIEAIELYITQIKKIVGSENQPIYFKDGVPTALNYTIETSVPANAIFTDTKYSFLSNKNATNGSVELQLTGDNKTQTVKLIGSGGTSVTSDDSGNITINSVNTGGTIDTSELEEKINAKASITIYTWEETV